MKVTAILNLKGGVAKTTTVIHMAQLLRSDHRARVLVVDCDSQCNLTQFFGADPKYGCTPEVLVNGDELFAISSIQPTETEGIDILAADERLMELDLSQLQTQRVKPLVFRQMAEELARREMYDYILFDCPPAFNSACAAALIASDDVLIPIKVDAFSVTGMANVLRQIRNMQKINGRLRVAGILPTMWYRSEQIAEAEDILRRSGLHVYPHIRRSNRMDSVTFDRALSGRKTGHMMDYRVFVREYAEGCSYGK